MSLDRKVTQSIAKMNYKEYLERGEQKLKHGDYDGAIKDYEKSLSLKQDFHSYLGLGVAFYKSGKNKNARNALNSSLLYKKSWIAYHYLGWIDFGNKDYKSSGKHFANAISLHKDAESYYGLALSCFEKKYYAEAIKYFKKSLEADDRLSRRKQLIELLMKLRFYKDALDVTDKSADLYSDYSLLLNKGICLYNLNRFENSKQCLIKSISLQPSADSLKWLSSCCTKMQQYHEAIDSLHRSIALEENYDNCLNLGAAYLRINDKINSEKYFRKAIQYKPTKEGFKRLGIALRAQGKREQSLIASKEYLSRSHAIAPIDTFLGKTKNYIHLPDMSLDDIHNKFERLGYEFHPSISIEEDDYRQDWASLMFLHIPKCAGSSFKVPLYSCFEYLTAYSRRLEFLGNKELHLNTRALIHDEDALACLAGITKDKGTDKLKSIFFTTSHTPPPCWHNTYHYVSKLTQFSPHILAITRDPAQRLYSHLKWESCHFNYEIINNRINSKNCVLNNTMHKFIFDAPFAKKTSPDLAREKAKRFYFVDISDGKTLSHIKSAFLSSSGFPNIVQVKKMNDGKLNRSNLSEEQINYLYNKCLDNGFLDLDEKINFEELHRQTASRLKFSTEKLIRDQGLHPLTFVVNNNNNNNMGLSRDGFIISTREFMKKPEKFLY